MGAPPDNRGQRPPRGLEPLREDAFGFDEARHLLLRAGFGGTPEQVQMLAGWGPKGAVEHLVDVAKAPAEPVAAATFDSSIMRPATEEEIRRYRLALRNQDEETIAAFRRERERRQANDRRQMRELRRWWLTRMIETPRPLEEKMTLFWHGHFATSYRKIENSWHMFRQNQLFRSKALGNYGELLFAIIRDPAMLAYLDNQASREGNPNENLARELMELFSLGEGNYTERDIKEGARALTGYTFNAEGFTFVDANHDKGSKNILGRSGRLDGDGFVRAILEQRACSRFMARKLYRFFVADVPENERATDPSQQRVIDEMASVMLRSRYEVAPVLRALFRSAHFYQPQIMGQQVKSPTQLVVGAARSLLAPTRDLDTLLEAMDLMGQNLFFPPSVKGWDGGRSWINTSTLFVRQNVLSYMLTGRKTQGYERGAEGERWDGSALLASLHAADPSARDDAGRTVDFLLRFMLGRVPADGRTRLLAFVDDHGGRVSGDMLTALVLLVTAMPEYQLC